MTTVKVFCEVDEAPAPCENVGPIPPPAMPLLPPKPPRISADIPPDEVDYAVSVEILS